MQTSKIKTAKPFNDLFPIDKNILNAIQEHMQTFGYDESQPIILWNNLVIDGHTRLISARTCDIKDIPVIEKDFKDEDEALKYALHNQRDRRNMTDADIIRIVQIVDKRKEAKRGKDGKFTAGRSQPTVSAEETAKIVGVGASKVKEARTVLDNADEQTKKAVETGEKTIHQACKETRNKKNEETKKKPIFNKTNDNIEWAQWSWNPIVGCEHGCKYCYARDIAMRFYGNFKPRFFPERLEAPKNTKHPGKDAPVGERNVFCVSMGDMFGEWVPQEWIDKILEAIKLSPEWNFLILTKNPKRLLSVLWSDYPNVWIGATTDNSQRMTEALDIFQQMEEEGRNPIVKFISCEPLLEDIAPLSENSNDGEGTLTNDLLYVDWIIIGGQSKSSKCPELQPKWHWVEKLLFQARQVGVPVYFKPNLKTRPMEYPESRE
jgi:protein gp37